ncbi:MULTISPECIES: hypothetical protein [Paraburkholderia]|uniref:hypothetical protein n=1 Tax=Paraburkholderia TaxID=1822464 RepID=UPI0013A6BED9|nr:MULTISPECIES: hypothetical protein [Paraburkholderia]
MRQTEATGDTESSGKSSDNRNTISLSGLFALPVNCVVSAMLQIFGVVCDGQFNQRVSNRLIVPPGSDQRDEQAACAQAP